MQPYEFTIVLDGAPTDADLDRLFEAGLDDALPEITRSRSLLHVTRRADSIASAIISAVADAERAGLVPAGLESEDLLTLTEIGQRVGRSRESVRLLAAGKRGPGGFPAPMTWGKRPLYSWSTVKRWFAVHYSDEITSTTDDDAETLTAADLLLRARLLSPKAAEMSSLLTLR